MTNQQINIAIAEACGWTDCVFVESLKLTKGFPPPNNPPIYGTYENGMAQLPNYCNDLNAMREAMLTLTNEQGFGFLWHLNDMGFVGGDWELLTLDSQVLAEAFLRTIGKWEEAK